MKKITKIITPLLVVFSLFSCATTETNSSSTSEVDSSISRPNSSSTSQDSTSESSSIVVPSVDVSKLNKMHFDNHSIRKSLFGYGSGSFEEFKIGNDRFAFYRAYKQFDEVLQLLGYESITGVPGIASSFYNTSAIFGIKKVTLSYTLSGNLEEAPVLRVGETRALENYYVLPNEEGLNSFEINISNANFFSVETTSSKLTLNEMNLYYDDEYASFDKEKIGSGEDQIRINLEMKDRYSLVHNETKVEMPVALELRNGEYYVSETKTYTYYDYQEVKRDRSLASKAALIDPVDIANYYIAFGKEPCNYVYKNYYSEASSIFGDKARCISTYTRSNGYALAVPFANKPGTSKPVYHELDVDLGLGFGYSSSQRGAGRLVIWEYGFSEEKGAIGYEKNLPVAVYTDDHYATFKEYLGAGMFTENFDAEMDRTNHIWSNPTTVQISK